MKISKSLAPKFLSKLAIASALSVSALTIGSATTPFQISQAYSEPVDLNAPQVPGFADVVEAVTPAVVSVRVEAEIENAAERRGHREFRFDRRFFGDEDELPFFKNFRRHEREPRKYSRRHRRDHGNRRFGMSQGSGFFISDDGYIVTNHHVISRGHKITVILHDGAELEAKLIGSDKRSDLAVLKVETEKKFTYVAFDDKNPRIGEWVVAVGNPFGLGGTVTAGIVSANGREIGSNRYDDFIQIDAAVNKGNSGGPTFNLSGKVVGINTAIFSPSGGNVGIAFAIPASTASKIIEDLMDDDGQVTRGWLGIHIQPVTREIAESVGLTGKQGAIVAGAQDGSPASAAGIKPGDIITAVDGSPIKGPRALARTIGKKAPDTDVKVSIWRDGAAKEIIVKLGKLQENASIARPSAPKAPKSLARLGMELRALPDGKGVKVVDVVPGSRAAKKGIRAGDIIITVNGEEVAKPDQVLDIIRQVKELDRRAALFQIEREGASRFVAVPLRRG